MPGGISRIIRDLSQPTSIDRGSMGLNLLRWLADQPHRAIPDKTYMALAQTPEERAALRRAWRPLYTNGYSWEDALADPAALGISDEDAALLRGIYARNRDNWRYEFEPASSPFRDAHYQGWPYQVGPVLRGAGLTGAGAAGYAAYDRWKNKK